MISSVRRWSRRHPILAGTAALFVGLLSIDALVGPDAVAGVIGIGFVLGIVAVLVKTASLVTGRKRRRPSPARIARSTVLPRLSPPSAAPSQQVGRRDSYTPPRLALSGQPTPRADPARPPGRPTAIKIVTLGELLALTPTQFEQLCVTALVAVGYQEVRRLG